MFFVDPPIKEPSIGFTDSFSQALTSSMTLTGLGIFKLVKFNQNSKVWTSPVDVVVNNILASIWHTNRMREEYLNNNLHNHLRVYNMNVRILSLDIIADKTAISFQKYPSNNSIRPVSKFYYCPRILYPILSLFIDRIYLFLVDQYFALRGIGIKGKSCSDAYNYLEKYQNLTQDFLGESN